MKQSLRPVAQKFSADLVVRTGHAFEDHCARAVTREFESKSGTGKTPAGGYGIRRRAVEKRFVRFGLAVFQDFALKADA
jgi:hypothetical protein